MVTKHFLKILIMFTMIIGLGLIGVFLSSNLEGKKQKFQKQPTGQDQLIQIKDDR